MKQIRKNMFNPDIISWDEHQAFWKNRLSRKDLFSFLILVDGAPNGVLKLDLVKKNDCEIDIFLHPKVQGKGIATQAIKELISFARTKNILKLLARVKPDNISSRNLFERFGFNLKYVLYEYEVKK